MRKLIVLVLLAIPSSLFAWGGDGHKITAELAFERLSPATQKAVNDILAVRGIRCGDPKKGCATETATTLMEVAPLPDTFRNQEGGQVGREWHFVDIEKKNLLFDAKRDCAFDDCVVGRIERLKALLADKHAKAEQRADALIYLTHFVGDVHQPFHCATNTVNGVSDNGANSVNVTIASDVDIPSFMREKAELHGVWDSTIIASRHMTVDEYVAHLKNDVLGSQNPNTIIGSMKTIDWANESHKLAIKEYVKNGATLDQAYFTAGQKIVDDRLLKGALRLQKLLEEALGK